MHTEKKHAETYNLFILRKAGTLRMSKDVSFKNRDRFIQLGIAIADKSPYRIKEDFS